MYKILFLLPLLFFANKSTAQSEAKQLADDLEESINAVLRAGEITLPDIDLSELDINERAELLCRQPAEDAEDRVDIELRKFEDIANKISSRTRITKSPEIKFLATLADSLEDTFDLIHGKYGQGLSQAYLRLGERILNSKSILFGTYSAVDIYAVQTGNVLSWLALNRSSDTIVVKVDYEYDNLCLSSAKVSSSYAKPGDVVELRTYFMIPGHEAIKPTEIVIKKWVTPSWGKF